MRFCETLSEARRAADYIDGTYRKVCGGWLVMSWDEYIVWKKQR